MCAVGVELGLGAGDAERIVAGEIVHQRVAGGRGVGDQSREESLPFVRIEGFAGVDQRQRHLALGEVRAERFAGGGFVALKVEEVVGDLKGDAEVAAEGGQPGDRLFVAAGVVGAQLAAAGTELGGLGFDDREVIVFGEVHVAAGDRLAKLASQTMFVARPIVRQA